MGISGYIWVFSAPFVPQIIPRHITLQGKPHTKFRTCQAQPIYLILFSGG